MDGVLEEGGYWGVTVAFLHLFFEKKSYGCGQVKAKPRMGCRGGIYLLPLISKINLKNIKQFMRKLCVK